MALIQALSECSVASLVTSVQLDVCSAEMNISSVQLTSASAEMTITGTQITSPGICIDKAGNGAFILQIQQ